MDASELFVALRKYFRERRQTLLEGIVSCEDIEKQRGRVRELEESDAKLKAIYKTTGDDDVDSD